MQRGEDRECEYFLKKVPYGERDRLAGGQVEYRMGFLLLNGERFRCVYTLEEKVVREPLSKLLHS